MTAKLLVSLLVGAFASSYAAAQGTFIYDQQSSDENDFREGNDLIHQNQPMGQSFTPSLSAVGFVRFYVSDGNPFVVSTADIRVNLRSNSIDGQILGTSATVTIPDGFFNTVNFFFNEPVGVSPGTTYYFQPEVIDSIYLGINGANYNYTGGMAFFNGLGVPAADLWFREGIVVPEPSQFVLFLAGGIIVSWCVRQKRRG